LVELNWINTYGNNWSIFIVGFFECIAISWFYGFNNFRIDLAAMQGFEVVFSFSFNIWRILWTYVTPIVYIVR
jgi:trehalose utilization protein